MYSTIDCHKFFGINAKQKWLSEIRSFTQQFFILHLFFISISLLYLQLRIRNPFLCCSLVQFSLILYHLMILSYACFYSCIFSFLAIFNVCPFVYFYCNLVIVYICFYVWSFSLLIVVLFIMSCLELLTMKLQLNVYLIYARNKSCFSFVS